MKAQQDSKEVFKKRLRNYGVRNIEKEYGTDKIYVFAPEWGYGIPQDCYDGLDVRLIESIGMKSLHEDHRLHRDFAHHVLIFKVK